MKRKRTTYTAPKSSEPATLKEAVASISSESQPMVRTQIYLSRAEHEFVQTEAARRGEPMAAVIRSFIDEKMEIPEDAWINNPILRDPVDDPDWKGHEDGAINHDHYIYGCPKKWVKQDGKWVEAPPLPDDYYENRESAEAYDRMIEGMK